MKSLADHDENMRHWRLGYEDCENNIRKALGFGSHGLQLINYLLAIEKQAMAWQLLDEVIDHSVNLHVAANMLRREIEKARGIE